MNIQYVLGGGIGLQNICVLGFFLMLNGGKQQHI